MPRQRALVGQLPHEDVRVFLVGNVRVHVLSVEQVRHTVLVPAPDDLVDVEVLVVPDTVAVIGQVAPADVLIDAVEGFPVADEREHGANAARPGLRDREVELFETVIALVDHRSLGLVVPTLEQDGGAAFTMNGAGAPGFVRVLHEKVMPTSRMGSKPAARASSSTFVTSTSVAVPSAPYIR